MMNAPVREALFASTLAWLILAAALPGRLAAAAPGDAFQLKVGAQAESGGLKVTLVAVPEDSRCPQDVSCVWAGQVTVQLDAEHGGTRQSLSLSTPGEKSSATTGDYTVTLQSVAPAPMTAGEKITDYVATLVVTKSAGGGASAAPSASPSATPSAAPSASPSAAP